MYLFLINTHYSIFRHFVFEKKNRRRPRTWASTGVLFIMIKVMINNKVFLRKTRKYTNFVINTHYLIFRRLFCWEKTPGGRAEGLAKWVGAIQSPSVAWWSGPRLGPEI